MRTCTKCDGTGYINPAGDPTPEGGVDASLECNDCAGTGEMADPDDDLVDALKEIACLDDGDREHDRRQEDQFADEIDRDYERARDAGTLPDR